MTPKQWQALDAKFKDGLNIPPRLRRDPAKRRPLDDMTPAQRFHYDRYGCLINPPPAGTTQLSAYQQTRHKQKIEKTRAYFAGKKAKAAVPDRYAVPADYKKHPERYRYNPRTLRIEPDPFYKGPTTKYVEDFSPDGSVRKTKSPRTDGAAKPRGASDDLGAKVSELCGVDRAKLRKFAQANGVWDDKYAALSNGLARMNIVNRLRGKVKKGYAVKW